MAKTTKCNKGCGQMIWFNWDAKAGEPGRSDFGKLIPLQVTGDGKLENERHNCPKSTWGKTTEVPTDNNSSRSETETEKAILASTIDITSKMETLLEHMEKLEVNFTKLANHIVHNPLDDDGDSEREEQLREPEA